MRLLGRVFNPFNLKDQRSARWRNRAEAAVSLMLESGIKAAQVADLGCGNKKMLSVLGERLPYPVSYQGYDLIPQQKDIIEIDLNTSFPERHYDLVFCMGLLEYLHDLNRFFGSLQRITRYAIVSYVASDCRCYSQQQRRAKGWVHDFNSSEIVSCFKGNGFDELGRNVIDSGKTYLFALKNAKG